MKDLPFKPLMNQELRSRSVAPGRGGTCQRDCEALPHRLGWTIRNPEFYIFLQSWHHQPVGIDIFLSFFIQMDILLTSSRTMGQHLCRDHPPWPFHANCQPFLCRDEGWWRRLRWPSNGSFDMGQVCKSPFTLQYPSCHQTWRGGNSSIDECTVDVFPSYRPPSTVSSFPFIDI